MTDWDARWMRLAAEVASWSKDPATKIGCVAVGGERRLLTTGYNGFPRGVNDDIPQRHDRPLKYLLTEHAERNGIYNAARNGVDLYNSAMYVTHYPCADCARGIIQAGILEVIVPQATEEDISGFGARWAESHAAARLMFREAGVRVRVAPSPSHMPGD